MINTLVSQLIYQTVQINKRLEPLFEEEIWQIDTMERLNKLSLRNVISISKLSPLVINNASNAALKTELKMLTKALERCINDNPSLIPVLEKYGISSVSEEEMVNVTGNNHNPR